MEFSFGTISHGAGSLAYFVLSLFILNRYLRRSTDRTLLIAVLMSSSWLLILCSQTLFNSPPFFIRYTFETLRNAAWFGVLYALLGIKFAPSRKLGKFQFYITVSILVLLSAILGITLFEGLTGLYLVSGKVILIAQVSVSLTALLLLEQIWRNSTVQGRSSIKYLAVAIAAIFTYDFLMYTDALLFQQISTVLWDTRGAVNALVTPLIAVTMINSHKQPVGMNVSRQMLFHTGTLVLAGVYLILMSVGGYYVNVFGGSWGDALQILFMFIAIIVMVLLLSSPKLRARMMVFISQNFFDYKYDYRDEWINSTKTLASTDDQSSLPTRIINVIGGLVGCHSGAIWIKNEENSFVQLAGINLQEQKYWNLDSSADLIQFFEQHDWIINLDEYLGDPTKYNLIEIPAFILKQKNPWLIIPLYSAEHVVGFILLTQPITSIELNWENYDLLKIVARQACSYLIQVDTQEKLAESRQFEAVNKTSAFMVHDIKTIIAQLSLLVRNAEKHKGNPAFIDDMINTTKHTVEKMDYLLQQIRNPEKESNVEQIELGQLLQDVYEIHRKNEPVPNYEVPEKEIWVEADRNQLKSVLGHIVQNAQDATPKDGEVSIATKASGGFVVIFVQDSGSGMSSDFIKNELFKPFKSTKGLTGMGIGAYQSREYVRKIGGSINVTSQLGLGSCFTIRIPVLQNPDK